MSSVAQEIHPRGARDACIFVESYVQALYNTAATVDGEEYHRRLRDEVLPEFTHSHYVHAVNCFTMDRAMLLEATKHWRSLKFSIRTRITKFIVDTVRDQDGSADMRHARVGISFDLIVSKDFSTGKKVREEESRTQGMAIATIVHSKIERFEVVCGTLVWRSS